MKQLNEAVETGDYPKIAMALGRDQSQLSEEIRAAMRATHQAFLTAVGDFVTEGAPVPTIWHEKKVVTLDETATAIRDLDSVESELRKIAAHGIIPHSKLIALQVYLKNSRAAVCGKVLEHGDAIRGEFANRIGQLLDLTNDALNAGIDNRDHKMLQLLSQQVLAVYNLSCLVEDTVVGWHLKKDIRRLLRIAANRLTEEAGIPTILPVRAVTNPPPSHRNRKE